MKHDEYCLIIGAARGGTSSLFTALHNCSGVAHSRSKELHVFDNLNGFQTTPEYLNWYKNQFVGSGVRVEATPSYLFLLFIPERVKALLPQARFIVLLRNPIDRAFSHYAFIQRAPWAKRTNPEKTGMTFAEAVANELNGQTYKNQQEFLDFAYLSRGYYAEQLERWFALFPRERFLIVKSEDYYTHSENVSLECLKFALDSECVSDPPVSVNEYKFPHTVKNYGFIDPVVRLQLLEHFRPYNTKLHKLLGYDFKWR